jgi:hypothetical protein
MNCLLMTPQVVRLAKTGTAKAFARSEFQMNRVDMFSFVYLLLERLSAFLTLEGPQIFMRRPDVPQKPVVKREGRGTLLTLEIPNFLVL